MIADLAYATHIRMEDATFALNEEGLLLRNWRCENTDRFGERGKRGRRGGASDGGRVEGP
jgi:hypothetical protein